MKKVGLIDYYLDEFHSNNYPQWLREESSGEVCIGSVWAQIDSPKGGLTTVEWCEKYGLPLAESIDQVVEENDCIIVASPDHPERHEALCQIPLRSGKPVYVDKTFALDVETAERLFALAKAHHTSLFSTSALRYSRQLQEIDKGEVETVISIGPGDMDIYLIHQAEPVIYLLGTNLEQMMYTGTEHIPSWVLQFRSGKMASITMPGWENPFALYLGTEGRKPIVVEECTDYFPGFIKELTAYFMDGRARVPAEETIAVIRVIEMAAKTMKNPGCWMLCEKQ